MRRRDWKYLRHFTPVDATPAEFIASIYGAERVISSSLHGIIFAESLGIPACWHAPMGGEDERKYYDYYFGTGRWNVKRFETIEDALRAEPMTIPRFRFADYLAVHGKMNRILRELLSGRGRRREVEKILHGLSGVRF